MMEKKRRKRMNNCFDALKELLLQSDLQQSSKLEKADVLEKTVAYMTSLQRENRALQHQIQQILQTESGQAYHNDMREGFSVSATATSDVLGRMPLPPPFVAPEFRNMLRQDIGERLATLLAAPGNHNQGNLGSSPPCLPTTSGLADSTLHRMAIPNKELRMRPSAFSTTPFLAKGDAREIFHPGTPMQLPFPPPTFTYAPNSLAGDQHPQPLKEVDNQVNEFVVVDVESCDTAAANYSQQDNDSGISSPPTAPSPHKTQTVEQGNCVRASSGPEPCLQTDVISSSNSTESMVYRPKASSSNQKKQRKEVWKPYERL